MTEHTYEQPLDEDQAPDVEAIELEQIEQFDQAIEQHDTPEEEL